MRLAMKREEINKLPLYPEERTTKKPTAEQIIRLNDINPQMAAALAKPLTRWRRYAGERSNLMRSALLEIAGRDGLSTDVFEVVTKSLA